MGEVTDVTEHLHSSKVYVQLCGEEMCMWNWDAVCSIHDPASLQEIGVSFVITVRDIVGKITRLCKYVREPFVFEETAIMFR